MNVRELQRIEVMARVAKRDLTVVNLQVPAELEAKLNRISAETGRTVDQVALDLLVSSVDHDEWLRREVEKGRLLARSTPHTFPSRGRPA